MKALLTLDGSEESKSILPTARRLCELVPDIELHMLTVLDPHAIHGTQVKPAGDARGEAAGTLFVATPPPRIAESHGEAEARIHAETISALEAIADESFPGVAVSCDIAWSREPAEAIVGKADELDADVIVMATHGRSGLSHLLAGSVAESVIRRSKRPVLVRCPER